MSYKAHSTAVVDDGVEIGDDTRIWHFCHVQTGARIGRDCVLGQNVYVGPDAVLGDGVHVQNNVSVYARVMVEDHVFLGPSMVFTNVRTPRANVERKRESRSPGSAVAPPSGPTRRWSVGPPSGSTPRSVPERWSPPT